MIGDEKFWKVMNDYYQTFRYSNATTGDFRRVAENVSERDLGWFFDQWIYRPGVPELKVRQKYDKAGGEVVLEVEQTQPQIYRLPLEVLMEAGSQRISQTVDITDRQQTFRIKSPEAPTSVQFDPNVRLLARIVPE
jgi:aminopeptidase N